MRRKDREITAREEIRAILARARVMHLGLNDNGAPYVVPMHYGFSFENDRLTFYMHCAGEGHKIDLIRRDGRVFIEIDTDEALIPDMSACAWGACYASVMGRGKASIVGDPEEKCRALEILMKTQTGEDYVFEPKQAAAVTILRVDMEDYTAKARKK